MDSPDNVSVFKEVFRRHASGVAVITATGADGVPVGFTATSLASLAISPPLATFNMSRTASSWPAIATTDHIAVHILDVHNQAVAATMSGDWRLRFQGEHWHIGPYGLPILNDVTTWFIGRIVTRLSQSGSAVVVMQVEDGLVGEPEQPLLYYQRQYWTPGEPA